MQFTNLTSESAEYRKAREDLRLAEIELMRHREQVATMRRALPPGPPVPDYGRQAPDIALPDVHDVDRRIRRHRAPRHAEC